MGMILEIRKALVALHYIVKDARQEKLGLNEIVCILDDMDIEIISNSEYHFPTWIVLEFDTTDPDGVPEKIAKLCHDLEVAIVSSGIPEKATFKFRKLEILHPGLMYRIAIEIEYVKVINV